MAKANADSTSTSSKDHKKDIQKGLAKAKVGPLKNGMTPYGYGMENYGHTWSMCMDTLEDKLEKCYETRPWRVYVFETLNNTIVGSTGL